MGADASTISPISLVPRSRGFLASGRLLAGRYRVLRLIGSGGMGEVYEVFDEELLVRVALKTLRAGLARVDGAFDCLRHEVRVGREVSHPNLCRLHDFGVEGSIAFLTMELISGPTLAQRLKTSGPQSFEQVLPWLEQLCAALSALHAAGLTHLDVKPGNLIFDGERLVLTDFGLASLQADAAAGGTPAYMAPEQLERKSAQPAVDLYAVGVVLFEALTGRLPYQQARTASDPEPDWGRVKPPPQVRKVISRCLAYPPERRPQSAKQLLEAVRAPRSQKRWWVAASVACLLAVASLGAMWLKAPTSPQGETLDAFGLHWKKLGGVWQVKDGAIIGSGGNLQSVEPVRDGVLELDVELITGPPDRDVGVAFRFDSVGGDASRGTGYAFNYSHTRAYRIVMGDNGLYETISVHAPRQHLDVRKNHFRISMVGKSFDLELNGQPFAHFEDASFASGFISFWCDSTSNQVRFSNLSFQSP